MSFFRVNQRCNGCLACVQNCPATALDFRDQESRRTLLHNMALCARCGNCWRVCPQGAVEFSTLLHGSWEEVASMDLVLCKVCGTPVFTDDLGHDLAQKLNREVEPLCPKHRKNLSLQVWQKLTPDPNRGKGVGI